MRLSATMVVLISAVACGCEATVPDADRVDLLVTDSLVLEIGLNESRLEYQLFHVEDALRLPDGGVLLANQGTGEIRRYSAFGEFSGSLGSTGDGPGQFRNLVSIGLLGTDSIWAFDRQARRLSIFSLSGSIGRTEPVLPAPEHFLVEDLLQVEDSTWFSVESGTGHSPEPGRLERRYLHLVQRSPAEKVRRQVDSLGADVWIGFTANGQRGFRHALFTPRALLDRGSNCVYVGSGDSASLRVYSSGGVLLAEINTESQARPVEPEHIDAWLDVSAEDQPPEARQQVQELVQNWPMLDHLPFYQDLVVDAEGLIWLQVYEPPVGNGETWVVVGTDGHTIDTVQLPEPMTIFEIGRDFLLGSARTPLGEEVVRVYSLERRGTAGAEDALSECH